MSKKLERVTKNCIICNKKFISIENKNFKTCGSNSCRAKYGYLKRSEERTCQICGKKFRKAKSSNQQNCEKHRKHIKNVCIICGKNCITKKGSKTCSRQCAGKYAKSKNIKTIRCSNCHQLFQRSNMFINKESHQFCSKACKYIYYEIHSSKKRLPSRYDDEWWHKRLHAIERDKCCLLCGSTKNLQVHHFIKLKYFKNPNDAHFINNLCTFCQKCHYKVEKQNFYSYNNFIHNYKDIV